MTDVTNNPLDDNSDLNLPSEIEVLRERCKLMGITYSNNAGVDALKKKIEDKQNGEVAQVLEPEAPAPVVAAANPLNMDNAAAPVKATEKVLSLRQHLLNEATKLVRLRITNMDPKKADLPGEIFTVANDYIGTIKKYVPFGEATDNGFHVPHCIYEMMKTREFLQIKSKTHPVTKQITVSSRWVREFGLEVLPPLSEKEIKELATAQAASGRLDDRD